MVVINNNIYCVYIYFRSFFTRFITLVNSYFHVTESPILYLTDIWYLKKNVGFHMRHEHIMFSEANYSVEINQNKYILVYTKNKKQRFV